MPDDITKPTPAEIERAVVARSANVREIIARGLEQIRAEILALDPETRQIDGAGDEAEIARLVLHDLTTQLRGFAVGGRWAEAEEQLA
jgi:hypothetical protein